MTRQELDDWTGSVFLILALVAFNIAGFALILAHPGVWVAIVLIPSIIAALIFVAVKIKRLVLRHEWIYWGCWG